MAVAARNKDPMQPEAVRFLQKCPNDVAWLCDRISKLSKNEADEENESLREDHDMLKAILTAVCSHLDVGKIEDIVPAIETLKLKTSEPDKIDDLESEWYEDRD